MCGVIRFRGDWEGGRPLAPEELSGLGRVGFQDRHKHAPLSVYQPSVDLHMRFTGAFAMFSFVCGLSFDLAFHASSFYSSTLTIVSHMII